MPKIWKVKAGLPSWKMLTLLSGNIFMCPHLSVSAMIAQLNGLTTSEMVSHTFFVFDLICPKNGSFSSWLLNQNLPHLVKKNYFFFQLKWIQWWSVFTLGSECPMRSKCLRTSNFPIKPNSIPSTNIRWWGSGSGKSCLTQIHHPMTLKFYNFIGQNICF